MSEESTISLKSESVKDQSKSIGEIESAVFDFVLENANDAVYIYNESRQIIYVNDMACKKTGYGRQELLEMSIADLDPEYPASSPESFRKRADFGGRIVFETVHTTKSGKKYPVEVSLVASHYKGKVFNSAFVRDIAERVKIEQAMRQSEERFKLISDSSPVALIIHKLQDGKIHYMNAQAVQLFKIPQDEPYSSNVSELFLENGVEKEVIEMLGQGQKVQNWEITLHQESDPVWVSLNTSSIELDGEQMACIAMMDVTEAHELSSQLSYQATYDDLTGLVNRREFESRLQEVIEFGQIRASENALCYLDLDQFKVINDTCGHMAGDELLRQLARDLYGCVRSDDTLARLGGDEFAILLENCPLQMAEKIANNVREIVQNFRFHWEDNVFNIAVSIGVTPISGEGETLSEVLRRADTACYAAKEAGRNRLHIYHLNDEDLAIRHGEMRWVTRINSAVNEDRLELWQQEIARINLPHMPDGQTAENHFEILLRLRSEDGELILPGDFLPAAERFDLAPKVDRWVVRKIFAWLRNNPERLKMLGICAVNLSGQSLSDESLLKEIIAELGSPDIPAEKICFEITETAAIANLGNATQFMRTLKSYGCTLALDDFGSGLSSFAYLKNLPVDFVKIDGFFVKDILTDEVDKALVKAINDMAHVMGKKTIAEFVENDEILHELIDIGVDYVQGYGIARPMVLISDRD